MPPKKKKFESTFPAARIKKIMQLDDDVGRVASSVPVLLSRAVEIFLQSLLTRSADYATERKAKTLTVNHLKHSIEQEKQWDFLKDLVAKVSDVGGDDTTREEPGTSRRGRKRQGSQARAPRGKRKQVKSRAEVEEEDLGGTQEEGGERQGGAGAAEGPMQISFSHSHSQRAGPSGNIIHVPLLSPSSIPQRLSLPPSSSHMPQSSRALPTLHIPPVPPLIHGTGHIEGATATVSASPTVLMSTVAGARVAVGTAPSLAMLTAGLRRTDSQQEEEEDYDV